VVDRLKELIKYKGFQVPPAELEALLLTHPAVADAVCFGVPDEKYGELVGAAVTLAGDAELTDLIAHCRERLAAFKVPARIDVLPEIPRTPTGKIQRRRVADAVLGPRAQP